MCLLYGILYLITLPGGYVLLVIYSICNLHVVSWGTREVAERVPKSKKKGKKNGGKQIKVEEDTPMAKPQPKSFLAKLLGTEDNKGVFESISSFITNITKPSTSRQEQLLVDICAKLENLKETNKCDKTLLSKTSMEFTIVEQNKTTVDQSQDFTCDSTEVSELEIPRNDLYNPFWIDLKILGNNDIYYLNTKEMTFWQGNYEVMVYYLSRNIYFKN